MTTVLIVLIFTGMANGLLAQSIGADDLIGAATDSVEQAGTSPSPGMAGEGEAVQNAGEPDGVTQTPVEESAPTPSADGGDVGVVEPGVETSEGQDSSVGGEAARAGGGGRAPGRDVENFVAFVYSPGPRDPFISPNAPSTIVQETQEGEDITLESLMAFAEKLKGDLGERIRVVGVSVPPTGGEPYALVIYASGKAAKGGTDIVEALPPRTVSVETGLPVRYPEEETLFISKLAQLVAQSSPIRLKRDSRVGAVIFPIQTIDDRGVLVSLPGYDEPILLPVYRDIDPRTESDN